MIPFLHYNPERLKSILFRKKVTPLQQLLSHVCVVTSLTFDAILNRASKIMCSCSLWSSENFQEDFALVMIKSGQKQREIRQKTVVTLYDLLFTLKLTGKTTTYIAKRKQKCLSVLNQTWPRYFYSFHV